LIQINARRSLAVIGCTQYSRLSNALIYIWNLYAEPA
jgi:hypothetical protein